MLKKNHKIIDNPNLYGFNKFAIIKCNWINLKGHLGHLLKKKKKVLNWKT